MGMMDGFAGFMQGTAQGVDRYRQDKRRDALVEQQKKRDDMDMKLQQLKMDMAQQNQEAVNRGRQAMALLNSGQLQGDAGQYGRTPQEMESKYGFNPLGYVSPQQMSYRTPEQEQQDALLLYANKKKVDSMFPTSGKNVWDVDKHGRMYNKTTGEFKGNDALPDPVDFKGERQLAKEWSAENNVFKNVDYQFNVIEKAAQANDAAGDIGLVFGIMKMFDPGSVVRESEFAVAQTAAGLPERLGLVYERLKSGERLSPEQRARFVELARQLKAGTDDVYARRMSHYSTIATQYSMNPSRIVFDYRMGGGSSPSGTENGVGDADSAADALISKYGGK